MCATARKALRDDMKYALLIYDTPDAWVGLSEQEREAVMGEYVAVSQADGVFDGA
jgi:hypothetical protein